jgi:hypothetical protein
MAALIAVLSFAVYMVFASILRGWVLSILWSWFVVPMGAPVVGITHAIGISMVVSFLTYQHIDNDSDKSGIETTIALCLSGLIQSVLALGLGWVVHSFMVSS